MAARPVAQKVARILEIAAAESDGSAQSLGSIYERELALDRSARQRAGAFYTPPFIVDFVLHAALRPALSAASADQILELRVADPACGSGVFLAAALLEIEAALARRGRPKGAPLRTEIANRCLSGVDIDPVAVELCRAAIARLAPGFAVERVRCADSLLGKHQPLDVVVTNPPWGQKKLRFDEATRAALRARFATARGVLDPALLFIELVSEMLVPGGRWAMVLPDIVLLKNYERTRRLMLESMTIDWIAHLGRAFPGVNLDACVIAATRRPASADHFVSTLDSLESEWSAQTLAPRRRRQETFASLEGAKFNIFASDDDLSRVSRLGRAPRVGDLFEVHEGVHSGNRREQLFLAAPSAPSAPLLFGRGELAPFRLGWSGKFVSLDPASVGRASSGYANLGQPEWHSRKKIVVRRTGDRVVAALDWRGLYVSNNFFVLLPKRPMSDQELRAHCGLLGSAFMTWYFRTVQPRTGRLFAELKIAQLARFPLAPLDFAGERHLAALVAALEREERSRPARQTIRAELDRDVASAYDRIAR